MVCGCSPLLAHSLMRLYLERNGTENEGEKEEKWGEKED
jgi:hypothetical protein